MNLKLPARLAALLALAAVAFAFRPGHAHASQPQPGSTASCQPDPPAAQGHRLPGAEDRIANPLEQVADVLRSPGFIIHALTGGPESTESPTMPELAARIALVVAGTVVVDAVTGDAEARTEPARVDRCAPRRARDAGKPGDPNLIRCDASSSPAARAGGQSAASAPPSPQCAPGA